MLQFPRLTLAVLLLSAPALAQTAAPAPPGNLEYSGDITARANGFRLEANAQGLAHVQVGSQLDARARAVAVDLSGKTISQVRALGSVQFKLNLTPRGGGAPAHIEASCDSATLTTSDRKLVLQGHLNGFYQLAGGARNTLSGESATLRYVGQNLVADLNGGAGGAVTLRIPAETVGRPDDLGDVLITAQRAQINQGDGTATFAGQARAVSSGGPNGFDVSAARFTLTRTPDGTIARLVTSGRTLVKLDLPPEPVPPGGAPGAATDPKTLGKPTHIEVAADSAVIERATSTATLDGNVKGFYRLMQGGEPQNYDFSGTRAVIRSVPNPPNSGAPSPLLSFDLHLSGATVKGPPFDLGF